MEGLKTEVCGGAGEMRETVWWRKVQEGERERGGGVWKAGDNL